MLANGNAEFAGKSSEFGLSFWAKWAVAQRTNCRNNFFNFRVS